MSSDSGFNPGPAIKVESVTGPLAGSGPFSVKVAAMRIRPFNFVVLSSILAVVFTASAQQPAAPDYPDRSALLVVRDAAGGEHAIKTAEDWAIRRGHILAGMQAAMGPLPDRAKLPPLDVQISESTDRGRIPADRGSRSRGTRTIAFRPTC